MPREQGSNSQPAEAAITADQTSKGYYKFGRSPTAFLHLNQTCVCVASKF
ncbi:hypothetical protein MANES_13G084916v8 [Manihot esculenta]|uniref:Uncharacterized protein n=1 Tax=Manihot esculenta TaxID=3983 RepID=A0ACB7GKA8_MANES|nr:hypothetical protein MANES_13G084916v8 [Manihot esculenta]